jgi:uncharacterized protein
MTDLASSVQEAPAPVSNPVARWFYLGAGSLLVGIGVLGIFLPLLPTTIFLLLAAACYGRSSTRAYRWLTTNRYFGGYLRNYKEHKGATVRAKVTSIASLTIGIGVTVLFFSLPLWVDLLIIAIAAAVAWHLLRLETIREPKKKAAPGTV